MSGSTLEKVREETIALRQVDLLTTSCDYYIKTFNQFCDSCKIPSCTYYLKEAEMKMAMFVHFKEFHWNHKNLKSLYDLRGRCLKIKDTCMDFEPYFRVHTVAWSLFTLKASYMYLVKWPVSTWSFMWWCQFIDLLKLKLAPVPCWISEQPIEKSLVVTNPLCLKCSHSFNRL